MGNLLTVRKLADKTVGERVVRYDPETGVKRLVNPATPGDDHEPWPLAGVEVIDAPDECAVPTGWVDRAVSEGWITLECARLVRRPGGPAGDPHSLTHAFVHADVLVIHAAAGDIRYRITHQPDKYVADGSDDDPVTRDHYVAGDTRVDWFYGLQREA
ncbi:hypothetical protein Drose_06210 [Dactylosporangium roseum]|uniref:Uncharacterized protein n=1 Tax=Dactylosporangium roseum TaxID=47989 RepID=A0ABY5Z736_9ACTN|nr:hypothetical protein [Dactylosporangium roseum]UWZ37865.1 hypothetical protein Drose_06210 [Dactylosporangium roseum]